MVGNIYYITMPYSNFKQAKGRPVLCFSAISNNDYLILPLTSNLQREGILITNDDIKDGNLKKESIIIVPKLTAVDGELILGSRFIATLKEESFAKIHKELCKELSC